MRLVVRSAALHGLTAQSKPTLRRTAPHRCSEEDYDILQHVPEASAFIRRALAEGGRCLIHCQAGINRSGALACAELMLHEKLPVLEAVARCKKARGIFLQNHGFQGKATAISDPCTLSSSMPSLRLRARLNPDSHSSHCTLSPRVWPTWRAAAAATWSSRTAHEAATKVGRIGAEGTLTTLIAKGAAGARLHRDVHSFRCMLSYLEEGRTARDNVGTTPSAVVWGGGVAQAASA